MGALTINRKRADEVFSLYSPSPSASFNSSNCSFYSNLIDTKVVKKPRVSYLNQVPAAKAPVPSIVDRFQKYPKPLGKFKREVHAPCRSNRVGFLSNSSKGEVKPRVSETLEKANCIMGNVVGSAGRLWDNFKKKKDAAFGTFRHVTVSEVENETVVDVEVGVKRKEREVSKDSSELVIIEDGIEVRSGVSDERRGFESKGLSVLVKSGDLDSKGLENSVVTDGNVLHSTSLGREAFYKELMSRVDQTYSPKLKGLGKEIETEWAILHRLRSLQTPKKEPEEDLLQELFEPLSEEEVGEVKRALLNANRRKVFVTHENSNIQITGDILQCLRPGAWLNDEVINVYLELLKERERREPKKYLNCHFFNTFFYKKLIGGRNGYDYKAVRRWTSQRKLGYKLNECDKIFVPIHKEVHWCLAVINKKEKKFQYLDSLGGRDLQVLSVLGKYYADEMKDKCGEDIDVKSWKLEYVEDLPEQQNGFDCGVFMIKYADFYSRGMGLHFSQDNMPYFRQRTAKEILKLQAH